MENQDLLAVRELVYGVGEFIRYWGFRRIHGQIWTLIYLSKAPLSGAELVDLLEVSKALVSPALKELTEEGLITEVISENAKVKRYAAIEDVESVIKKILKTREQKMMNQIETAFSKLKGRKSDGLREFINPDRQLAMGQMIEAAHFALEFLVGVGTFGVSRDVD